MKNKTLGNMLLLLTAIIWGFAFVAQRTGMEYIGPFTFNGIRFIVAGVALIPVIAIFSKNDKHTQTVEGKKTLLKGGIYSGVALFLASSLQQIGLVYTTAGKGGFITSLYVVIVPIIGLFLREKIKKSMWISVMLATVGLYLLSVGPNFTINFGDFLVLLCAIGFAFHIIIINQFSNKVDSVKMSCIQFFVAGILSIPIFLVTEDINIQNIISSWMPILYAGVLSGGVAYTLQIVGQKYTDPVSASLLLSLESVFSVIGGILLLQEFISTKELIGCAIMFIAIVISQFVSESKDEITN